MTRPDPAKSLIKIVYFDEQSASDYLDITAGGKQTINREDVTKRITAMHAKLEANIVAKFSWMPFLGASAGTGTGAAASRDGQSVLSKTLSNTILTDYLLAAVDDRRVQRLSGLHVYASTNSLTHAKTFTPYLIIARTEEQGVDLAKLDEALTGAKGYYEMVAADEGGVATHILRFNIHAFRNSYGLIDLTRMQLVYHGIRVGDSTEADLSMEAEMRVGPQHAQQQSVAELFEEEPAPTSAPRLPVYDVILAGVEDG